MIEDRSGRVIDAARRVFLRHGYRRVTMGDIAAEAGISRPALYLVFPSKEEIFTAALDCYFTETLAEMRDVTVKASGVDRQLAQVLEIWCVRPFEMGQANPDSKDLYENGLAFATEVFARYEAEVDVLIAQLLKQLVRAQSNVRLPAVQIARLMVGAVVGFKQTARDAAHLRQMIGGLVTIVLASLRP